MSTNDQIQREILENEQWLDEALPADSAPTEHLKLRVQVELQEQWLATQAGEFAREGVPPGLKAAVRQAVTVTVGRPSLRRQGQAPRGWTRVWGAGLGLAATLAFAAALYWSSPLNEQVAETSEPSLNVFAYDAEEQELDTQLEDALSELDDLVAARDEAEWDEVLEEM